jgi:hypothetical protein
MANLWVIWLSVLYLWGAPALALGLVVGFLPNRYHLPVVAAVICLFVSFIVSGAEGFNTDHFWGLMLIAFPPFTTAVVSPLMLIRLARAREQR